MKNGLKLSTSSHVTVLNRPLIIYFHMVLTQKVLAFAEEEKAEYADFEVVTAVFLTQ